ncbi:hypothetical protein ACJROX_05080 [Pseudalkalibacillus sp. A8]|uniref:hypothetical protein n=1 Tax=Pseudalkalibacillus sp. A8 TaxID=3382641 RepID=UPI0038B54FA5
MDGFASGFQESIKKQESLHIEVFLKLVTMAHTHMMLLEKESMNREQEIRYGTRKQVENRLYNLLHELEEFSLEHTKAAE